VIEQGLVKLVQTGLAASSPPIVLMGGFLATLPKGQVLPSWTYQMVSAVPDRTLDNAKGGLFAGRIQIDCYGAEADDAVSLSWAIARVLNGQRGTLADADGTYLDSAFLSDTHDPEVDEASRTWRRVIEFDICYKVVFQV
jgi:hypothetical protein